MICPTGVMPVADSNCLIAAVVLLPAMPSGVPTSWKDVTIDKMRTEGAFLVSASRRGGKTQWIRIESLAGEPCRLKCDVKDLQSDGDVAIKKLDNGVVEIAMNKGESVLLFPRGKQPKVTIEPVAAQGGQTNTFGLP